MPSVAPLEDLERAHEELQSLEMKHPDAYADFAEFFANNRSLGYKNLCKLLMGEQTPRELKGLDEEPNEDESESSGEELKKIREEVSDPNGED